MGKAVISAALGEGLYSARIEVDRTRIEDELAWIDADLQQLQSQIDAAEEALKYKQLEVDEALMLLRQLIDEYAAGLDVDADTDCDQDGSGMMSAVNSIRAANGLPALTQDSALDAAAQGHATYLAQNNTTGHTGRGGSSPSSRIYAAGFSGSAVGENVAWGQPDVATAFSDWMNSPGHRAAILNPAFDRAGVGYNCRESGPYRHFWVQTFGG